MGKLINAGRATAVVAVALSAMALTGCGSMVADLPVVGLPANAPPRAAQNKGYLPVNDTPANRAETPMDVSQQTAVEQELSALRAKQKAAAEADAAAIAASPAPQSPARSGGSRSRP